MCGILGICVLAKGSTDPNVVSLMNAAITPCGPYNDGFFVEESWAAFAKRRLAIIDVAGGDHSVSNDSDIVANYFAIDTGLTDMPPWKHDL